MRQKNKLRQMLSDGQIPLGMQCFTGDPSLVEVMGMTGFDFVMFDTEHSANNARAMENLCRTAESVGLEPYVRVPDCRAEVDIRRALEAGAMGLFLPMVKSVEDVLEAAKAAFFPPHGERGICPSTRASRYHFADFAAYTAWNDAEVALVPMIEHPDAVECIEAICALECVDMIVFGAGDLAYAMHEGTAMMKSPKVQAAYRRVMAAAKANGVDVVGGPVLDPRPESCRKALEDGVRIFCLGLDTLGFRRFCEATVTALNAGVEGSGHSRPAAPASGFQN